MIDTDGKAGHRKFWVWIMIGMLAVIIFLIFYQWETKTEQNQINLPLLWEYNTSGGNRDGPMTTDSRYILTGSNDGTVHLLDIDGNLVWQYMTGDWVLNTAMSRDGHLIVAGSDDGYIYFLNNSGNLISKHPVEGRIFDIDISNDGNYVAIGCSDYKIYFFDNQGKMLWENTMKNCGGWVKISEKYIVVSGSWNNVVYLFDYNGNELWNYSTNDDVLGVDINEQKNIVVATNTDGSLFSLDLSGNLLWAFDTGDNQLSPVKISNFGNYIATGSGSFVGSHSRSVGPPFSFFLFDMQGNMIMQYNTNDYIYSISFTNNDQYVCIGTSNSINIFEISSEIKIWGYQSTGGQVFDIKFSDNIEYLAVTTDSKIYLFDSSTIFNNEI